MAVKLRLRRGGTKKKPIYMLVAADIHSPRDGKFIENIGQYEPLRNPALITLKEERVLYWLKNGAQPSDTVRSLFRKKGLWLKWSLMKKGTDSAKIQEEYTKWEALQADKLRRESERKVRLAERRKKKAEPQPVQESASA